MDLSKMKYLDPIAVVLCIVLGFSFFFPLTQ